VTPPLPLSPIYCTALSLEQPKEQRPFPSRSSLSQSTLSVRLPGLDCSIPHTHTPHVAQTPAAMRDRAVKDVFVLFELLPDATDGSEQRTRAVPKSDATAGLLSLDHTTVVHVDSVHHPAARAALKAALRGDGEAAKVPLVLVSALSITTVRCHHTVSESALQGLNAVEPPRRSGATDETLAELTFDSEQSSHLRSALVVV
jgi:hypothetical protein